MSKILVTPDTLLLHRLRKGPGQYVNMAFRTPESGNNRVTKKPDLMFGIEGVTTSNISYMNGYTACFHYFYSVTTPTSSVIGGEFKGGGSVRMSELTVVIANDTFRGTLLNKLEQNIVIDEISIVALHWAGEEKPKIRSEDKFKNCYITDHTDGRTHSVFVFSCEQMFVKINSFKEDNTIEGGVATGYNFKTASNESDLSETPHPS